MADNFNLRAFLSENKLTKNAQLLKEQEDYKYFDEEGTGGFYMTTIDGVQIYSLEDSSVADTCFYALIEPETTYMISIDVSGEPVDADYVEQDSGVTGKVAEFIANDINKELGQEGEGEMEEEAPIQGINLVVLDDNEGGDITLEKYSDMDDEFQQIFSDGLEEGEWEATSLEQGLAELDDYFEERGDPSQQDAYNTAKQQFQSAVQGKAGKFYVHGVEYDLQLMFIEGQEGGEEVNEAQFSDSYDTPAAKKVHGQLTDIVDIFEKSRDQETQELNAAIDAAEKQTGTQVTPTERRVLQQQASWIRTRRSEMERESVDNKKPIMKEASYKVSKNSKQAQHLKKGDIITSGDEVVSVSAGAKTPAGKVEVTLKTKNGSTKTSTWGKTTMIGVKPVTESKLTTKERRLVEMVQKAMKENTDISTYTYEPGQEEDEYQDEFNPADAEDQKDYRRDQYRGNQMEEGDEMADETVIPEYHTIDELMKEIDFGTSKIAEEHKIKKMKDIAEALRAKVKNLEEGEHAKHIDQKAVKQMGKDIAALEKTAAKLQGVFDKKFNKKEKPAAAPKAEKQPVALAEGTFDLRKFLVENKLTKSSRIIKEQSEISREEFIRGLAAKLKQQGFSNVSKILNSKTGMGSFDQGTWNENTSDCMLDDEVIEKVEPIIHDYCDQKGVEVVS